MNVLKLFLTVVLAASVLASCRDIPLVFDKENTAAGFPVPEMPSVDVLEAFVDRFLLGKDVPAAVTEAPMFVDVDTGKWINW